MYSVFELQPRKGKRSPSSWPAFSGSVGRPTRAQEHESADEKDQAVKGRHNPAKRRKQREDALKELGRLREDLSDTSSDSDPPQQPPLADASALPPPSDPARDFSAPAETLPPPLEALALKRRLVLESALGRNALRILQLKVCVCVCVCIANE
jgi:hypothetical protein